jgi:ribosomal RNA-processing protein 9
MVRKSRRLIHVLWLGLWQLPATCVALTHDETTAYTGSKDNSLLRWDVESGKRVELAPRWSAKCEQQAHEGEVLAVAVSSDGRYVASGGRTNEIRVYDSRTNNLITTFPGHRDAVSALCFRTDTHALYSGSFDRCVKHWNLDEMAYVETLYGHQSEINGIDAWRKERAVTCGRDRTVSAPWAIGPLMVL